MQQKNDQQKQQPIPVLKLRQEHQNVRPLLCASTDGTRRCDYRTMYEGERDYVGGYIHENRKLLVKEAQKTARIKQLTTECDQLKAENKKLDNRDTAMTSVIRKNTVQIQKLLGQLQTQTAVVQQHEDRAVALNKRLSNAEEEVANALQRVKSQQLELARQKQALQKQQENVNTAQTWADACQQQQAAAVKELQKKEAALSVSQKRVQQQATELRAADSLA